jgi:hypothetical protein
METAEMYFIRALTGTRMMKHKFNGNIRRKLGTAVTRMMMMTMIQFK